MAILSIVHPSKFRLVTDVDAKLNRICAALYDNTAHYFPCHIAIFLSDLLNICSSWICNDPLNVAKFGTTIPHSCRSFDTQRLVLGDVGLDGEVDLRRDDDGKLSDGWMMNGPFLLFSHRPMHYSLAQTLARR